MDFQKTHAENLKEYYFLLDSRKESLGLVEHLRATPCDKISTYKNYKDAGKYNMLDILMAPKNYCVRKEGFDINDECDFCGCTEMDMILGDEMCRECCDNPRWSPIPEDFEEKFPPHPSFLEKK